MAPTASSIFSHSKNGAVMLARKEPTAPINTDSTGVTKAQLATAGEVKKEGG